MNIIFGAIFTLSIVAGWAFGHIQQMPIFETLICIMVSGFMGSSIIALIFSYLYFLQKETDKDKIQRLQQEINLLKETKRIE